jgi:methionyl-tRNA formyltransferase
VAQGLCPFLVVTVKDQPFGRRRQLQPTPVKQAALELNLECWQPASLKKSATLQKFQALDFDFGVVVSYGKIIPESILQTAGKCFLNVHPSALPRFRGAAPMERAILAGDEKTAVCIMQMTPGLDDGPVLLSQELTIPVDMDIVELKSQLSAISCKLLPEAILGFDRLFPFRCEQTSERVLYADKIISSDGFVDISSEDGICIYNKIRAMALSGGVSFSLGDKKLSVFKARFVKQDNHSYALGEIVAADKKELAIALMGGLLFIDELQLAGKKRLPVREFLSGMRLQKGDFFGSWPLDNRETGS